MVARSKQDELVALVVERLKPLPITTRAMFGGHGLFLDGAFFGIVIDGKLYFRTDEESRSDYRSRGMPALQPPRHRPRGPNTVDRNLEVPSDVLDSDGLLKQWALRASQAKR